MTVSLAVIGKYVPQLQFIDVMLGTEPALDPQYNYYQRLLAHDENEAAELVETYLQKHTLGELCDEVLVPTLVRTREDFERSDLSQEDVNAILEATREVLEGRDAGRGRCDGGQAGLGEGAGLPVAGHRGRTGAVHVPVGPGADIPLRW